MVTDGNRILEGDTAQNVEMPARLAFIGFGEAASAFVEGWTGASIGAASGMEIRAYDIKTDADDAAIRDAKWADYGRAGIAGCAGLDGALEGTAAVFSTVTADQALVAAASAAQAIHSGALYFDCNSCAPGTKRKAARLIDDAGGRYVDVAVMAPVRPGLHRAPLIVSGPHAEVASEVLEGLDMKATLAPGEVGTASAIKMIRSVMVKGLEALTIECVAAGRRAGVDETVLASLEATFPGFGWKERAAYMMERAMTHGIRRAAEMREVALTVEELGLRPLMSAATAEREQEVGDMHLDAGAIGAKDYAKLADALLANLKPASG